MFANVAQALALRIGIRRLLPFGLLLVAAGLVLYARLPVDGHYFWDLFPAVPAERDRDGVRVHPDDDRRAGRRASTPTPGVASGLINTSQQIGGAIGVAAATTIAATYTSHYLAAHPGRAPTGGAALTHGFSIAFYVLAAVAAAGGRALGAARRVEAGAGRGSRRRSRACA